MESKKGSCAGLVRFRAHLQTHTIGMISLKDDLLQGSWVSLLTAFLKHWDQILKVGMSYEHLLVGSMLYPSKGPFTSAWRRAPSQTHSHLILSCMRSHFCTIRAFHAHAGFSLWDIAENMQGSCLGKGGLGAGLANTGPSWQTPLSVHCTLLHWAWARVLPRPSAPPSTDQKWRAGWELCAIPREMLSRLAVYWGEGTESIDMQIMERH